MDFYFHSTQSAINCVKGKSYCCWRKRIPEIKTVVKYEIALEEAVPALFDGDDKYIVELLADAQKHKKWPKNYESYPVNDCLIGNQRAIYGKLVIKGGLKLVIKFQRVVVKIYPDTLEINHQNNVAKDELKMWLTEEAMERISELQEVLAKILHVAE